MRALHLFTNERLIGSTGSWKRLERGAHSLIAIPQLRLEHGPTMEIAEGATLLSLFGGASCDLEGWVRPVTVYSGFPELFLQSTPTLRDVIVVMWAGRNRELGLADIIRYGADLLREEQR